MCYTPITIKNKSTSETMIVGCGKCMPCHLKYCNQWNFRMRIHANHNPIFYCLTLTYDNGHLPYVKGKNGKIYMTLVRAHAQQFFKNLRNNQAKRIKNKAHRPKISYIICGEYGDQFKRPHYHAIVFNANPDDILQSWKYGAIYFGASDLESTVNYTLKYALKSKIWKSDKIADYQRPFINVSKGIGEDLIYKKSKVYPITYTNKKGNKQIKNHTIKCVFNNLPDVVNNGGIKTLLPRYYSNKLLLDVDTEQFRDQQRIKQFDRVIRLSKQGIDIKQFYKQYHSYVKSLNKKELYDNEILTSIPAQMIENYQYFCENKNKKNEKH